MEYKKLGEIATYINGFAFKPEDRGTEGLPIIRIQDLTGNSYDLAYYDGEYPEKIEIDNGDVCDLVVGEFGNLYLEQGRERC